MKTTKMSWAVATLGMVGPLACSSQSKLPQQPQISVNPTSLQWSTDVGLATFVGTSIGDSLQIQDLGQDPLKISGIFLDGGDGAFTILEPAPSGPDVDAGAQTTINTRPDFAAVTVFFKPTAGKAYDGVLTITSNGANDGGMVLVPLHGVGVTAQTLNVTPTELDWLPDSGTPANVGGAGVLQTLTITNSGQSVLNIISAQVVTNGNGVPANTFTLVGATPADSDGGLKNDINTTPDYATLSVLFRPASLGTFTGTLTIDSTGVNDGGIATIPLVGVGAPDAG